MLYGIARVLGFVLFMTGGALMIGSPEPAPLVETDMRPAAVVWPSVSAAKALRDRKVYVVSKLPSSWPVASAVTWIDQFTGSDWVTASRCPTGAYRCVTIRAGNLPAPRLAETWDYDSSRVTILVDLPYAKNRLNTTNKRKWVLAHEFGHAAGLREHSPARGNFMYASTGTRQYAVTTSQRSSMAQR
jgi:hypothetical protein